MQRRHFVSALTLAIAFNFNFENQVASNPRALSERCLQMSVFSYLIFDIFAVKQTP